MQASTSPLPKMICSRMPVLRRDDQQTKVNEAVITVQRQLNNYGFPLIVDGFFGPKTEAAVRSFQARAGILVDGIVGPQTWEALGLCTVISEGC